MTALADALSRVFEGSYSCQKNVGLSGALLWVWVVNEYEHKVRERSFSIHDKNLRYVLH